MARGKANSSGRSTKMSQFTPMVHQTVDCLAFRTLTPLAQCLYWRLRRFAGYDGAKNGEAFLSVRDAAAEFNVHKDTVRAAFYLLQARGFIVATQIGSLGVEGEGKATLWRLTELPAQNNHAPTREFLAWKPGHDFPVQKGKASRSAKQKPVLRNRTACPNKPDVQSRAMAAAGAACPNKPDVLELSEHPPVLTNRTYTDLPGGQGA
jgi:DNA-binding transcriptional MocR family regulator